jgi:type VI secretion system protein ImpE
MKALELFNSGNLTEAINAATATLRSKPMDTATRFLLAQLFCFQEELEKADRQFETFASQAAQPVPGVSLCRQLIRAATCRREFYLKGRMPEFFSPPEPFVEQLLRAWVYFRAGDLSASQDSLQKSQALRPEVACECNGRPVSDFLDLDDFLAPVLEVLTPTGKYFWVPLNQLRRVEFRAAERPLDILWRPATLDVIDGPSGDAYVPAIYFNGSDSVSDALKLGRETDWREPIAGVFRGIGQRCFLAGEDDTAIMDIESLKLTVH